MKKRNVILLCILACCTIVQLVYGGRHWSCFGLLPDYSGPAPQLRPCSEYVTNQTIYEYTTFFNIELKYSRDDFPYSYNDFISYHQFASPIEKFTQLINYQTENLPAERRSYIEVTMRSTNCTSYVKTKFDNTYNITDNQIIGVKSFSTAGGDIQDVRIVANSILSSINQRLVWTKTYTGEYLTNVRDWSGDPDNKPTIASRAVMQYVERDSCFLNDDTWMNAPVYNDGDFIYSGGGSGGSDGSDVIDPFPCDSLL